MRCEYNILGHRLYLVQFRYFNTCTVHLLFCTMTNTCVGRVAQSVQRLTTGWTVRDRIPVGTRFSPRPDRPWGPPSLLYNGYRVFLGGRGGRGAGMIPPINYYRGPRKSRAIPLLTLRALVASKKGKNLPTNTYTIITQIIILLHVSTLSCHRQGACNQYLA